jgi:hypothetical protein
VAPLVVAVWEAGAVVVLEVVVEVVDVVDVVEVVDEDVLGTYWPTGIVTVEPFVADVLPAGLCAITVPS